MSELDDLLPDAWARCPVCEKGHKEVADLVRELAESDPADETSFGCVHCGEELPRHLDTCLWLRARALAGLT